jgi:hypothetical protein
MNSFHAVVWIDHHAAHVLRFNADSAAAQTLKAHEHATAQHGSAVRSEHEFFGEVCAATDGVTEVLVTGSHTAIADFRHYADKHRPQAAARIKGYEVTDRLSDNQLVAMARAYFLKRDRMAGVPTPT